MSAHTIKLIIAQVTVALFCLLAVRFSPVWLIAAVAACGAIPFITRDKIIRPFCLITAVLTVLAAVFLCRL